MTLVRGNHYCPTVVLQISVHYTEFSTNCSAGMKYVWLVHVYILLLLCTDRCMIRNLYCAVLSSMLCSYMEEWKIQLQKF
jgi:hypothetical protein